MGLVLKLAQRIDAAFFKPKISGPNETAWAMPVVERVDLGRWVQAILVVAKFAAIADQQTRTLVFGSTDFADLHDGLTPLKVACAGKLTSPGFPFLRSPDNLGVVGRSKLMWDPTTVGAMHFVSTKSIEHSV